MTPITGKYNQQWLRTEYDIAILRAHHATDRSQFRSVKGAQVAVKNLWGKIMSDNPESDFFVFRHEYKSVEMEFKVKKNSSGYFLYYMRIL